MVYLNQLSEQDDPFPNADGKNVISHTLTATSDGDVTISVAKVNDGSSYAFVAIHNGSYYASSDSSSDSGDHSHEITIPGALSGDNIELIVSNYAWANWDIPFHNEGYTVISENAESFVVYQSDIDNGNYASGRLRLHYIWG